MLFPAAFYVLHFLDRSGIKICFKSRIFSEVNDLNHRLSSFILYLIRHENNSHSTMIPVLLGVSKVPAIKTYNKYEERKI